MAEPESGIDEPLPDGTADEQPAPEGDAQTDGDGVSEERFTDEVPADPTDPQYKYWQGAYTKTRQRDRERYGTIEQEHRERGEVLRNFQQSDEYALQVFRQRFPRGLPSQESDASQTTQPHGQASSGLEQALAQELGSDLAFLAPRLGPVLDRAIQAAITGAVKPLEDRTEQRLVAARRREEDQLLADMDSQHPGWETRYAKDMKEVDDFLNSDALRHPKWGDKYELLYRLVNKDQARIDATREMSRASRSRLTTGRSGTPSQPNSEEHIRSAKNNSDAFRLAAEAAIQELQRER